MVDSIANAAISTLLRAQSTGSSASIAALKSNQKATQAIINQLQEGVDQGKALMKQASTGSLAPSASLPRGSLVNLLV